MQPPAAVPAAALPELPRHIRVMEAARQFVPPHVVFAVVATTVFAEKGGGFGPARCAQREPSTPATTEQGNHGDRVEKSTRYSLTQRRVGVRALIRLRAP